MKVTKLSNSKLLLLVENCIRVGAPFFIEDIAEMLDPGLEPVLQKAVFNNQGRLQIHLEDSDVDYDPNFKLYISTKMANPHYFPEVCIKVTVINFTVTFDGLEELLLEPIERHREIDHRHLDADLREVMWVGHLGADVELEV